MWPAWVCLPCLLLEPGLNQRASVPTRSKEKACVSAELVSFQRWVWSSCSILKGDFQLPCPGGSLSEAVKPKGDHLPSSVWLRQRLRGMGRLLGPQRMCPPHL